MKIHAGYCAIGAGGIVTAAWLFWLVKFRGYFDSPGDAGTFGDMFGSLNTLFTGIAFVGVVYTMFLQKEEVAIAKSETADSQRTEIVRRFESTFFQLLNLLNGIVSNFEYSQPGQVEQGRVPLTGRTALKIISNSLMAAIYAEENYDRRTNHQAVRSTYDLWLVGHSAEIAHYLRVLYRIMRHIDSADDSVEKKAYAKILRALLSEPEVALLAYDCFDTRWHMKALVEKYSMLRFGSTRLIDRLRETGFFSQTAFNESDSLTANNS